MTPFWILQFIISLPKTSSTGENPAITATMPFLKPTISRLQDARHFWRQGHKTFSGFIKARERPRWKGGRAGEAGGRDGETEPGEKIKKQRRRTSSRPRERGLKTQTNKGEEENSGNEHNRAENENKPRKTNKTEEDQRSRRQGRAKYKKGRKTKTQRQGATQDTHRLKKQNKKDERRRNRGQWSKGRRNSSFLATSAFTDVRPNANTPAEQSAAR